MNLSQPSSFHPPHYLLNEDSEGVTKLLDGSFHHEAKSFWLPENWPLETLWLQGSEFKPISRLPDFAKLSLALPPITNLLAYRGSPHSFASTINNDGQTYTCVLLLLFVAVKRESRFSVCRFHTKPGPKTKPT